MGKGTKPNDLSSNPRTHVTERKNRSRLSSDYTQLGSTQCTMAFILPQKMLKMFLKERQHCYILRTNPEGFKLSEVSWSQRDKCQINPRIGSLCLCGYIQTEKSQLPPRAGLGWIRSCVYQRGDGGWGWWWQSYSRGR